MTEKKTWLLTFFFFFAFSNFLFSDFMMSGTNWSEQFRLPTALLSTSSHLETDDKVMMLTRAEHERLVVLSSPCQPGSPSLFRPQLFQTVSVYCLLAGHIWRGFLLFSPYLEIMLATSQRQERSGNFSILAFLLFFCLRESFYITLASNLASRNFMLSVVNALEC